MLNDINGTSLSSFATPIKMLF